ncbi:MAG: hypothetical protein LBN39_00280, partial [Planctomycetaceae bacterium]|nr:hypothetical protein [Planctomycetaceae bacterium]
MAQSSQNSPESVKEILGYLNFSSGERNLRFFQVLNSYWEEKFSSPSPAGEKGFVYHIIESLENDLTELSAESAAFKVDDQAGQVLKLVREELLPAYRQFHSDLLHHHKDDAVFNSFFLAKAFETVLQQEAPRTDTDKVVKKSIKQLNDYIGYRPIPVLEGEERHQPYMHEWVAPVPLYIDGAGVAAGRYRELIEQTLTILNETDPQILYEACLDPKKLREVVIDPRAYDFDHPINRKPNYHFGIWDPLTIDNKGYYRRFVVHQVTLDGILQRLESAYMGESDAASIPRDELLYEAAAVLAGTMLMGAGVCGDTPQTYDSETSLGDLMPVIAGYRDRFYEQILEKIPEKMKPRILEEKERLFQSFGGCRQGLNRQLAKRRADQLQRISLARIYAQMGYSEAAREQTNIIAVPSARIATEIDCLITDAHLLIDQEQLEQASDNLPKIEDLIRRGINCGAIVDPWTILGFGGNYSLFHNLENSIHDHRIDDLIDLLEDIFDLYSRLQKEAA